MTYEIAIFTDIVVFPNLKQAYTPNHKHTAYRSTMATNYFRFATVMFNLMPKELYNIVDLQIV